jgi:hypothetical protein
MANRGLGFHQDATTFDAWLTDLVDTMVAAANGLGWSDFQVSGVTQRRILTHTDGGIFLDIHRKSFQVAANNSQGSRTLEMFLGFADAWDSANKRPTAGANVSIVGCSIANNSTNGSNDPGGSDIGSWTGQFYWWIDANGFVALFKPDATVSSYGNSGNGAQTILVVLQRTLVANMEQAGGSNFVCYTTTGSFGSVNNNTSYYGGSSRYATANTGTQTYWNVAPATQPNWYDRWTFAHPFTVTTNGFTGTEAATGHSGRGITPYCATWPYEAGGGSSEAEGAYGGSRQAQGGNAKVYFQFPWFANDQNMQQILVQTQYFFRGQLSRGLIDGDQVAWVNGAQTQTYLYKVFGNFGQGVLIRYA